MPFNHFDHIAGLYNRMGDFNPGQEILRYLNLAPEDSLLDVGGGTGRVANAFRGQVRHVMVADPSYRMLKYAREKGLSTTCAPAESLPFASNTFDRILIVDAFHHVQDQQATAAELWRILCQAGRILIIEPDIETFSAKLIAFGEKMLLMHSHFLPAEAIAALFNGVNAEATIFRMDGDAVILLKKK